MGSSPPAPLPPGSPFSAGARASLIYIHLSAKQFFSIQVSDRCSSFILIRHFDEAKTSRLATILISYDRRRAYLPEGLKGGLKVLLFHVE
jgi:hypothetical protein